MRDLVVNNGNVKRRKPGWVKLHKLFEVYQDELGFIRGIIYQDLPGHWDGYATFGSYQESVTFSTRGTYREVKQAVVDAVRKEGYVE